MRPRAESKRSLLADYLAVTKAASVDEQLASELSALLSPVSAGYLRRLLRQSGVPLAPMVEGVNQESLEHLERTLVNLAGEYESGRREARRVVIEAKERLRWSEARATDPERRADKSEMLLWVMTWLENPAAFPVWVRLRKRTRFAP
jgi:hypothetical protein